MACAVRSHRRRRLLTLLAGSGLAMQGMASPTAGPCAWPLWEAYLSRFVQADGRVIDDQHETRYTTSEGQAYTLFFALVAGDRSRFEVLLRWIDQHLAEGQLGARQPGWRWGRRDDGTWTLLDTNAATDADLWLAHSLLEASRLWSKPEWRTLALRLLDRVCNTSLVTLPGVGPALLPGPSGSREGDALRLNPSYFALHQLRAFEREQPAGPWRAMADAGMRMLAAVSPHRAAPDWVRFSAERGFHAADDAPPVASYDAIRVPLWAALAPRADPHRERLLALCAGWTEAARKQPDDMPPLRLHTDSGAAEAGSPPGFTAALLPWLAARGEQQRALRWRGRLYPQAAGASCEREWSAPGLLGPKPTYYDQVLAMFALGALQGRYAFDRHGRLQVHWSSPPGQNAPDALRPT